MYTLCGFIRLALAFGLRNLSKGVRLSENVRKRTDGHHYVPIRIDTYQYLPIRNAIGGHFGGIGGHFGGIGGHFGGIGGHFGGLGRLGMDS